jgi:hypothetical protein
MKLVNFKNVCTYENPKKNMQKNVGRASIPYGSHVFFPVGFITKEIKLIISYRRMFKHGLAIQIIGFPVFVARKLGITYCKIFIVTLL